MDVLNVDHVEYYVADAEEAAYRWRADYGFTRCGDGDSGRPGARAHSVLVRQGRINLLLTSATAAAHPAYGYVSRHGDGVAVIAFTVADVRAAYQEAIGRGAVPVTPPTAWSAAVSVAEVGGFGDVVHRLVQRDGAHAPLLPGRIRAAACVPPDAGILDAIDHFAVCVPAGSLEGTARFYREVFDFEQIFEERVEVGRQAMDSKVVQSRSAEVTFTVLEPDAAREPGQIDAFLEANGGAGVQHLAFTCEDITAAVRTLRERGVGFLEAPDTYYDRLSERLGEPQHTVRTLRELDVLVDRDHWGDLFQIFTESAHPRRTYFNEIIDRRGARTFGSGNIKALYQAVQRGSEAVAAVSG